MVTPVVKITANEVDVTSIFQKNLQELVLHDVDGTLGDELNLKVEGLWQRPKYQDVVKVWLGWKESDVIFMGSFVVQNTERINGNILSIHANGVDFSSKLKEKKDRSFEKKSLAQIVKMIAQEHGLEVKTDAHIDVEYLAQHDESDLAFFKRIGERYGFLFSIKNLTLIFLSESQGDVPVFDFDAKNAFDLRIKHSNKTFYRSVRVLYHSTKENIDKEVVIGEESPQLKLEGAYSGEEEALRIAKTRLERANRGAKSGSLTCKGAVFFAGGKLNLKGSVEDDGMYLIKSVRHQVDSGGWVTTLEFENQ